MATPKLDLLLVLNDLYDRPAASSTGGPGRRRSAGQKQVENNAAQCLSNSSEVANFAASFLDKGSCQVSNNSRDGRDRAQKTMRVIVDGESRKLNFRQVIYWCL